MPRQIALLRGVNLGSVRRVRMPELREVLERGPYDDVRTYLVSGNVVLSSDAAPEDVARDLEQRIAAELGVDTQVVVRTRDELAAVVAGDPLAGVATEPRRYQVSFLSAEPDPRRVEALTAEDFGPERVVVRGREVYAWHPNGLQRSRLARMLSEDRLGVTATARNWNTVTALLAMADE